MKERKDQTENSTPKNMIFHSKPENTESEKIVKQKIGRERERERERESRESQQTRTL